MMKFKEDTPSEAMSTGPSHLDHFINGSNYFCFRALQGVQPALWKHKFRHQPNKSYS